MIFSIQGVRLFKSLIVIVFTLKLATIVQYWKCQFLIQSIILKLNDSANCKLEQIGSHIWLITKYENMQLRLNLSWADNHFWDPIYFWLFNINLPELLANNVSCNCRIWVNFLSQRFNRIILNVMDVWMHKYFCILSLVKFTTAARYI